MISISNDFIYLYFYPRPAGVVAFLFTALRDTFTHQFFNKFFSPRVKYLTGPVLAGALCTLMAVVDRDQALPQGFAVMNQVVGGERTAMTALFASFVS